MSKKSFAYSAALLLALVGVAFMLNQGLVQGVVQQAAIDLSADSDQYLLGQPIRFDASLEAVDLGEVADVRLQVSGPEPLDCELPTVAGNYELSDLTCAVSSGRLHVFVEVGASTLPGGTLPVGNGVELVDRVRYLVDWTPPISLTSPPAFALITNGTTEFRFAIPQLTPPTVSQGTVLPATELVFQVPSVGAPAGTVLPSADFAFNIPQVAVSTNAGASIPDLPDTESVLNGFDIPQVPVATAPGGEAGFPDTTFAFNLPAVPVPTAPAGEPDFPGVVLAFTVPGDIQPAGLATDGSNFYIVRNDSGTIDDGFGGSVTVDEIAKVDSSGTLDASFGTGGLLAGPSDRIEGITYLNGSLWVVESQWRCFDLIETASCDASHRVFKLNPSDLPSGADINALQISWKAKTTLLYASEKWREFGGIAKEGSGSSGSLWLGDRWGGRFFNLAQAGTEIGSPYTDRFVPHMDAVAFNNGFLYTADGSTVTQWTKSGNFVREFGTSVTAIGGMTFIGDVIYLGHAGSGKVSKGFVGSTVDTSAPKGIASSSAASTAGEALWVLVAGEPKHKLLKINPSTGALISTFGTSGFVDAPSNKTEGITFLGNFLYIVSNETDQWGSDQPKLYKVNPSTGAVTNTYNLATTAQISDRLGGITSDGTNLIVYSRQFNDVFVLNTTGQLTGAEKAYPCCPSFSGVRSLAYNSSRAQYFAGTGSTVGIFNSGLTFLREQTLSGVSGIQGMTFEGNLLYVVHTGSGKVSKSFLATTVTTRPTGITFTPSTSGPGAALWVLVDGDPYDKLLKVDPATGALMTDFGTGGAVDVPSDRANGITFLNTGSPATSFLWVVSNEAAPFGGKTIKLYKVNTNTGAVAGTLNLSQTANVFDDVGGVTNDGTNLILYFDTFNDITVIAPADGSQVQRTFLCCPSVFGASGLAYHSGRNQFFAGKTATLLTIGPGLQTVSQERTLTLNGGPFSGSVRGLTFNQDILYVARNDGGVGKVSVGALRKTVTIDPRGLAFSPTGSALLGNPIGRALWALVDGDPTDVVVKMDMDAAGALLTSFDAPSSKTEGITFLDSYLWIVADDGGNQMLYKVNPVTGATVTTFNLSTGSGAFLFDAVGGVTNNGSDLMLFIKNQNRVFVVNTAGEKVSDTYTGSLGGDEGGRGVAFRTGKAQLFVGKTSKVTQFGSSGSQFFPLDQFDLVASLTGIQGMSFDTGVASDPADDVLYIAHTGSGKVSKTAIPSEVTNRPRALAYDADANELYILVDGKGEGKDHIVVVNPAPSTTTAPTVIRSFAAPSGESEAMTFMAGALFVAANVPGAGGPGGQRIFVLNPTTGAAVRDFSYSNMPFITGLSNDGQSLIAVSQDGFEAVYLDADDGAQEQRVFFFDPSNPGFQVQGFQGLATRGGSETEFFPVKAKQVYRFDPEGRLVAQFDLTTPSIGSLRGAVFVGGALYLAEATGSTIRSAGIPVPTVTITKNPRGMATDGQYLYLVVDASPVDKIMKLDRDTGQLVTSFGTGGAADAPGNDTGGLAWHNNALYAVTNDLRSLVDQFGNPFQAEAPAVHKLDPTTGAELYKYKLRFQGSQFGPPPGPVTIPINALASDGTWLYGGFKAGFMGSSSHWVRIGDPGQEAEMDVQFIAQFSGILPPMDGFEAFTVTLGIPQQNRQLIGAGSNGGGTNNVVSRFDRDTGVMFDQFVLPASSPAPEVRGMAYVGDTLFLADDATDSILGTQLPENTIELTVIGQYVSIASVMTTSDSDTSDPVEFSIVKNDEVVVRLTNPADGFIATTAAVDISGLVNDPAIEEVGVGIQLPSTVLFEDQVAPGSESKWSIGSGGGTALWHIACNPANPNGFPFGPRYSSPSCSWRYAKPNGPDFDTGGRTVGTMRLASPVTIGPGARLRFDTGYTSEPMVDADLKLVQVAEVTQDLQGNDVIGGWKTILQIVGPGFGGSPPPADAHPDLFQYREVDQLFVNPNLVPIELDLGPLAGKRILLRFRFDSVDKFANQGEGWYVDGVRIEGAGFKLVLASTTLLATPQLLDGTTYYRSFIAPFALAEGQNDITAKGEQPYAPFLTGEDQVSGFVDTLPPQVALFGVPAVTKTKAQTLQGTVADATFQFMEITQTTSLGSQTIYGIGALPTNGAFSLPVSLVEGLNTFEAVAFDGGNASTTAGLFTIADTVAPSMQDVGPIFPVGAVSGRPGDEIVFQVNADDGTGAVSGVEKVELLVGGQVSGQLLPAQAIPQIVRDELGINGGWVLFSTVPAGTPPGKFGVMLRATDFAGNSAQRTVSGDVTASLEAMNVFLFDGANLVGINLQASASPDFLIQDVLAQPLDTNVLAPQYTQDRILSLLGSTFTSSTASLLGQTILPVASTTGFQAGDRVVVGPQGDLTTLTANSMPNATSLTVASTTGFTVGQTVAVNPGRGPFKLGFAKGWETTTITSIPNATTLNVSPALQKNHFVGDRVSPRQSARVASVDSGAGTITLAQKLLVGPASGQFPVEEQAKLGDIVKAIFHFSGGLSVGLAGDQGVFEQFIPGVGGDLTTLGQGLGYWFITDSNFFARSTPLPGFVQGPVIPVRMQLDGVLFDATGQPPSLPATVTLDKAGWHQIALISENNRTVVQGARGLFAPTQAFPQIQPFVSLIEFQKFIGFNSTTGAVEIVGGAFKSLFGSDTMPIARGFYVYLAAPGIHTP